MLRKLLSHIGKYKKYAVMTPLFAALEVFMETMIPYITAFLIDEGVSAGDMGAIYKYGGLMLLVAALSLSFAILAGRFAANASTGFAYNLRDAMFRKVQTYSFANIDKFSTGGIITRLTTDVNNIQNAFQMAIRMAVRAPLTLISSMVMCFVTNVRVSLFFLGAVVLLAFVLVFFMRKVTKIFEIVFKKYDLLNADVQENVTGIRVVKAYVREQHEDEKFYAAARTLYDYSVKAEKIMALAGPVMNFVIYSLIILISWFGANFIVAGEMTPGNLTSFFSYIMTCLMSLMMLVAVFVMITMSLASGRRIAELLDEVPAIRDPEDPVMEVADGSIEFRDVWFSYKEGGGDPVLRDIDLNIPSGSVVGIIGGTGSGKSSLVNLISRLYDVTEGSVLVGGVDVRNYDIETLRNKVAVVLQKNVLFAGSVLDNLRWGKADATIEECRSACRAAAADEFIEQMPEGYETHIEQGGSNVSGGQKQRLCIARALLKDPKVLILDDSTSAVDTATDARIRKSFRESIPGTTKLIIAQRISSVMDADMIIVMDEGKVESVGTHDELMESSSIYREIYETQTSGGGDFDEPAPGKEA